MDLFLGITYCTGDQHRFQKAMAAGELEKSIKILEKLPHASLDDHAEQMQRNAILAIAYRELIKRMLESGYLTEKQKEMQSKLALYQKINADPNELIAEVSKLNNVPAV